LGILTYSDGNSWGILTHSDATVGGYLLTAMATVGGYLLTAMATVGVSAPVGAHTALPEACPTGDAGTGRSPS
jgi:hypothetical protein